MKKTAAIYARVSSDRQKEEGTIASQRAALLEYAQANGLMVPPEWIFEDEGYRGAVLARPALERLRDLAAEGQIEMVLVNLSDLRERAPALKKKIAALENEGQNLRVRAVEDQKWIEINQSLESFVARLNQTAQNLTTAERQKIVRLLVKQIDVGKETITIHHSIPIEHAGIGGVTESSRLYKRRQGADRSSKKPETNCGRVPVS